jgi:hypothetical protein
MMRSLVLAVSLFPLVAMADPSSQFDDGTQGWSVVDLDPDFNGVGTPYAAVLQEGYIEFTDPSARSFFFEAPSDFRGDLSAYFGGSLRYSQKVSPITPEWREDPDVVIVGGGLTLVFQNANSPGGGWTDYSIGLANQGWRVGSLGGAEATPLQFRTALGSVERLRIRGEYITGVFETTSLDNVLISAVPEPGNWALMLSGMALLAGVARGRVRA